MELDDWRESPSIPSMQLPEDGIRIASFLYIKNFFISINSMQSEPVEVTHQLLSIVCKIMNESL